MFEDYTVCSQFASEYVQGGAQYYKLPGHIHVDLIFIALNPD